MLGCPGRSGSQVPADRELQAKGILVLGEKSDRPQATFAKDFYVLNSWDWKRVIPVCGRHPLLPGNDGDVATIGCGAAKKALAPSNSDIALEAEAS